MEELENSEFELPTSNEEQVETNEELEIQPEENNEEAPSETEDYDAYYIMKSYGYKDGMIPTGEGDEKIHISELDYPEQLEYLAQLREMEQERLARFPDLEEEDLNIITKVKENNLSLTEYMQGLVEYEKEKLREEYEAQLQEEKLRDSLEDVDAASDEDIMLHYLKSIMGEDVSNEELLEELEAKKSSKSYSKEVDKIRADYKAINEQYIQEQKDLEYNQLIEQANNHYTNTEQTLRNLNTIMGMKIDSDKKRLLEMTAVPDERFNTHFSKSMIDNPENQIKAMWFLEHEEDLKNFVGNLYNELNKAKTEYYNKGKNDAIKGKFDTKPQVISNTIPNSIKQKQEDSNEFKPHWIK